MTKLIELLTGEGGLIRVRGGIALILIAGTVYMWINGNVVGTEQMVLTSLVVGNYFGARFAGGS